MDRITGANWVYDNNGKRIFTNGPPATTTPAEWLTAIQEEVLKVIESAGYSPSLNDNTQLWQAIVKIATVPVTPYIKVSEVQPSGTGSGTFTSGAYQTRTLNTKDSDTASIATLAGNQLTLPAGTYNTFISAPACLVNAHRAILYNVTDASVTLMGQVSKSEVGAAQNNYSIIIGRFTITGTKTFEVRDRCASTSANGFGYSASFGDDEVFTVAEFWKIS